MFEWFFNNPFVFWGTIALLLVAVSIIAIYWRFRPTKEVLSIDESDNTGKQLKIIKETSPTIYCEENRRFHRFKRAINFNVHGKHITRFLSKRGTAYTKSLEGGKEIKIGSIYDALETIWGADLLNKLKDEYLKPLKSSIIWVTVQLEETITPTGYAPMKDEDIRKQADENMAGLIGRKVGKQLTKDYLMIIMSMIAGMAILFFIKFLGILKF